MANVLWTAIVGPLFLFGKRPPHPSSMGDSSFGGGTFEPAANGQQMNDEQLDMTRGERLRQFYFFIVVCCPPRRSPRPPLPLRLATKLATLTVAAGRTLRICLISPADPAGLRAASLRALVAVACCCHLTARLHRCVFAAAPLLHQRTSLC